MAKMQKSFSPSDLSEETQDWVAQFRHHLNGSAQAECFRLKSSAVGRYRTLRLRRFGRQRKTDDMPTLIIPPLAVHDAGFADLFSGNSLIETLLQSGHDAIHLADWRKLTPDSVEQTIDACISDLAIAIDDLGVPVVHPVPARVWEFQKRLHVNEKRSGFGHLLEALPAMA